MNDRSQPMGRFLSLVLVVLSLWSSISAANPAVESGYVDVDGGRIFYDASGDGPAIIMIHDGIVHRETWDAQFTSLSNSYRVVRWDRRGYGRSDAPTEPFSNVDDLKAVMDKLAIEKATIMGCSSGGLLSIYFTLEHPERVSSLVLVGPIVSGFSFSEHFRSRGGRGQPDQDASLEERIAYWSWKDPWITGPESREAKSKIEAWLKANPQNLKGQGRLARWPRGVALGRLSEIKVPTLLIVGEADIPDVHSHVGAIEAGIAGARRVVLINGGHLVHLEVPEAFNRVVREFLESLK